MKEARLIQMIMMDKIIFHKWVNFIPVRHMSRVMRKLEICICKNKGADQLCSNCTAEQRLCFRCMDNTIHLLLKSKSSSF